MWSYTFYYKAKFFTRMTLESNHLWIFLDTGWLLLHKAFYQIPNSAL